MRAVVSFFFFLLALYFPIYGQQIINYGETLTESISPAGEVDVYIFSGIENEKVIIRMTESSNSPSFLLEPKVELFGPSGSFLQSDSDNAQAEINFTLASTGTYTIFASDTEGDDTGNYGLFIQRMVDPGNTIAINYGETLTGSISTFGDVDTYSFSGSEGDKVILRLTESSNSPSFLLEPFAEIYGPAGDLLLSDSDNGQSHIEITLPADGSYTILASDSYPGDDTGSYGLFIQRIVNPGNTTIINYGETLTGTISTFGDIDTYSFLGGIGDSVIIRLTEDPSSPSFLLEPFVELFDVSGDLLIAASDNVQAEIGFRLQNVGYHTILASDSYPGDDTGNYSIFIFGFISSQILAFPSLIEFGDVPVGQIANDSFIVFNRGISSVNIDSITINGTNPANFSVDTTSFSLDPGDSLSVSVSFAPDTLGFFSANLNINSTGGNATISLNGTGIEKIPVELTSFKAKVSNGAVILNWTTATEINNQMFEIERRLEESQFVTIGFVEGNGTTTETQTYSYLDNTVEIGTYYYRLKQIDFDGSFEYSDEIEVEVSGPLTFALEQNYPNPFNPSTSIRYAISSKQFVTLKVYDVLGNEVAILVNEEKAAGSYEISFSAIGGSASGGDAYNLSSGIYFYKLQAGSFVVTKKMILMK